LKDPGNLVAYLDSRWAFRQNPCVFIPPLDNPLAIFEDDDCDTNGRAAATANRQVLGRQADTSANREAKHNAAGIVAQQRSHGWQLYVTNSPADKLSLAEAVLAYRQTPTYERGFSRLKNRPLGLRPLYLV
jgi:hypothetical protein